MSISPDNLKSNDFIEAADLASDIKRNWLANDEVKVIYLSDKLYICISRKLDNGHEVTVSFSNFLISGHTAVIMIENSVSNYKLGFTHGVEKAMEAMRSSLEENVRKNIKW